MMKALALSLALLASQAWSACDPWNTDARGQQQAIFNASEFTITAAGAYLWAYTADASAPGLGYLTGSVTQASFTDCATNGCASISFIPPVTGYYKISVVGRRAGATSDLYRFRVTDSTETSNIADCDSSVASSALQAGNNIYQESWASRTGITQSQDPFNARKWALVGGTTYKLQFAGGEADCRISQVKV